MTTKVQQSVKAGIAGTIGMTALTMIAPMMGMPIPKMEGSMMILLIGGLMGHIIYGIIVGVIVKDQATPKTVI